VEDTGSRWWNLRRLVCGGGGEGHVTGKEEGKRQEQAGGGGPSTPTFGGWNWAGGVTQDLPFCVVERGTECVVISTGGEGVRNKGKGI